MIKMIYNYSKLRGKVVEVYGTLGEFANAMGWSERTNSLKMNGKVEWKQNEIIKASKLLGIPTEEIDVYFFNVEVQQTKQKKEGA